MLTVESTLGGAILTLRRTYLGSFDDISDGPTWVQEKYTLSASNRSLWSRQPIPPQSEGVDLEVQGDISLMSVVGLMFATMPGVAEQLSGIASHPFVMAYAVRASVEHASRATLDKLAHKIAASEKNGPEALSVWLDAALRRLLAVLPAPSTPSEAMPAPGQSVGADIALASLMASKGKMGRSLAAELRKPPVEGGMWRRWTTREDGEIPLAIGTLARVGWKHDVQPKVSRANKSKPLSVRANTSADGQVHARFPKVASPMTWAMGAPGKEHDIAARDVDNAQPFDGAAEVDGQRFAHVPSIGQKALVPRSWSLLPSDREKYPHQTSLPLSIGEADALPVVVSQNQGVVMSTIAGKIALLVLASPDVQEGDMVHTTLAEITRLVCPAKRIQQREITDTMKAINELDKLSLFLPDGRKLRIFDVTQSWAPERAGPGLPIYYGLTKNFALVFEEIRARGFAQPALRGQEYTGDFLMNLSGMLSLPNNEPALLRYYTRACAEWNAASVAGDFNPALAPARTAEEWAIRANALGHGVVEYLESKATGQAGKLEVWRKAEAHKSRKKAADDLAQLEGCKLVRLESTGRGALRVLPPDNWLEARRVGRETGGRPHPLAERQGE